MQQIRAYIMDNYSFAADIIDVVVALQSVDPQTNFPTRTEAVLHRNENGYYDWRYRTDEERQGLAHEDPNNDEVLKLPIPVAEALAQALSRHFHGPQADAAVYQQLHKHEAKLREQAEDNLASITQELLRKVTKPDITEQGQALMKLAEAVVVSEQRSVPSHDQQLLFHGAMPCRGHMVVDFFPTCTYQGGNQT